MMERRAMSFVGLTKPIQKAMSVCGTTSAASVDYSQDEQGPTKSKKKRGTDALWIESLLGSAQSAKKLFAPTIPSRLKKSNANLHVRYRNSVFFQETCSICKCKKLFLCLFKQK